MTSSQADRRGHIVRGPGSLTIQNVLSVILGFVLLLSLVRFLPQSVYPIRLREGGRVSSLGLAILLTLSTLLVLPPTGWTGKARLESRGAGHRPDSIDNDIIWLPPTGQFPNVKTDISG